MIWRLTMKETIERLKRYGEKELARIEQRLPIGTLVRGKSEVLEHVGRVTHYEYNNFYKPLVILDGTPGKRNSGICFYAGECTVVEE